MCKPRISQNVSPNSVCTPRVGHNCVPHANRKTTIRRELNHAAHHHRHHHHHRRHWAACVSRIPRVGVHVCACVPVRVSVYRCSCVRERVHVCARACAYAWERARGRVGVCVCCFLLDFWPRPGRLPDANFVEILGASHSPRTQFWCASFGGIQRTSLTRQIQSLCANFVGIRQSPKTNNPETKNSFWFLDFGEHQNRFRF